jgi:hypothetical protein
MFLCPDRPSTAGFHHTGGLEGDHHLEAAPFDLYLMILFVLIVDNLDRSISLHLQN